METVDEMRAAVDATLAVLEAMGADVKSRGFPGAMVDALKELGGNRPVREGDAGRRGRGLFATRRMRRGDVATVYPCDLMRVTDPDGSAVLLGGRLVPENERWKLSRYMQFLRRDADGTTHEICGDPSKPFDAGACGHLANDPHPDPTKLGVPGDSEAFGRGMVEYVLRIQGSANCAMRPHRGVCVLLVATRDVEAGEELLVPYGYEYWSSPPDPMAMLKEYMASRTESEKSTLDRLVGPYFRSNAQ